MGLAGFVDDSCFLVDLVRLRSVDAIEAGPDLVALGSCDVNGITVGYLGHGTCCRADKGIG